MVAVAITRTELTAADLRGAAARARDADAVRRMLALALVLEGHSRREAAEGCAAKFAAGREWPREEPDQAATRNSSATKLACARISRPPTFRTCPFLIIAIAS